MVFEHEVMIITMIVLIVRLNYVGAESNVKLVVWFKSMWFYFSEASMNFDKRYRFI